MLAPGFSRVVHCDGRTGERFAAEIEALLKDPASLRSMGARAKEAAKGMSFEEAARNLADAALGLVPQGAA